MRTQILIFFSFFIINCTNYKQQNISCENLIKIDSLSFYKNRKLPLEFVQKSDLKKENDEIKIQDLNKSFKDNLTEEQFKEYSIVGKFGNWNLILGQDHIQNYYYLISKNKIDSLVGPPRVFGKTLLSIEEAYTDFQEIIEIWDIQDDDNLMLNQKLSLKKCYEFRIMDSYLFEDYLFIKTGVENRKSSFYKFKFK